MAFAILQIYIKNKHDGVYTLAITKSTRIVLLL